MEKEKEETSSDSSASDSDSSSSNAKNSDSERSYSHSKDKTSKTFEKRSSSNSDSSESESKKNKKSGSKDDEDKIESLGDKSKKHKYDEVQKSKWDSPSESRSLDRKYEKDSRNKRHDRDVKESRKYHDYDKSRNDRRDNYRNKDYRDNRRFDRDRGRYDRERRQNNERYRPERRRSRDRSRSQDDNRRDKRNQQKYRGNRNKRENSADNENYDWGKKKNDDSKKPSGDREKPNFGLSGKLTEDTNTFRGVVIKYSEPPEARKPKRRWRLYPFKGEKALPTLYIHRESAYLMGRDRKVVDFPLDHPSCSKQHAVLQYRLVPFTRDDGSTGKRVRPYLIDLDSANGTYINNKPVEARKYYELLEKDVIKFGYSTREYVLLHENSKDETMDDDVKNEDEEPVKEEPQD